MDAVLKEIAQDLGMSVGKMLEGKKVIYKDSIGIWDGVNVDVHNTSNGHESVLISFYSIHEADREKAIQKAAGKREKTGRDNDIER